MTKIYMLIALGLDPKLSYTARAVILFEVNFLTLVVW